jgi:phospholipase/carboxylesterase
VLVHGREQDPEYMLEHLAARLDAPGVAFVLPRAQGGTWYPDRYWAPRAANEPFLSGALHAVSAALEAVRAAGLPDDAIVLGGFSQGACVVADHVARWPAAYRGVAVLTGALVGAPDEQAAIPPLAGLPMHFATGRYDEWVSLRDAEATARAFAAAGADVTFVVSDDPEHRIADAAVEGVGRLLARG